MSMRAVSVFAPLRPDEVDDITQEEIDAVTGDVTIEQLGKAFPNVAINQLQHLVNKGRRISPAKLRVEQERLHKVLRKVYGR